MNHYETTWDLDSIFKGGSKSEELKTYITKFEENMDELAQRVEDFSVPSSVEQTEELGSVLTLLETTTKQLREIGAFASCLTAQDMSDNEAKILTGKRSELGAAYVSILAKLDQKFLQTDDAVWAGLLESPNLQSVAFVLDERRSNAKGRLPLEQEILINDLSVNGYSAWNQMYSSIVAKMSIEHTENGETKKLSMGQAANRLSTPDRDARKEVFGKISQAWEEESELFGETLNNLAGFRLQTYKHRKWDNPLKEPLELNRMSEKTLDAMWGAISEGKAPFVSYLKRKAELLGLPKLEWQDLNAPITKSTQKVSYDEAAAFILEQFAKFSPQMAEFSKMAFEKRWIEAEDRAGKRPGGFCTSFPDSEQTRIFMTFSGSATNISTLAHELGHAYHQHVMNNTEALNQRYAMNVAETASTFAEMVVSDAAVKNAGTKEEKIALLEDKIKRSIAFFMNIHSRFLFETRFYEERKKGAVSVERLNELAVEAQQEAYGGELASYNPTFWASTLHFHITGVPFYNFPYTFGYLFSQGIYAKALETEGGFEESYNALLRDTGRMTVEQLAQKHLGVDLEQAGFWEEAIALCVKDVEEFLELTEVAVG
ncbi:M3 family oligoendopeptidase [Planomicrobium sp. CPCC 101079]|uniref:M3 family oligoendopeptidase n=1 Tax=Planomicrobium sp. CPCC 101079 TaxID=2599618 RepID=UPI0011B84D97|nr:M3 family oligoendopeptidase [Planomicrobium sp. CPCC 101079]TWT03653.1 M3 family oligoendopeptidase [Planomicrobium sp. CPCC 101079]